MTEQDRPTERGMSRFTACVLMLAVPVVVLFGCGFLGMLFIYRGDGHTHLSGEVVSPNGKPVAGAEILLSEVGARPVGKVWQLSDQSGRYSVSKTHAPTEVTLNLTVKKDGYKSYSQEFTSRNWKSISTKIVLEP